MSRRWEAYTADVVNVKELFKLLPGAALRKAKGQRTRGNLTGLLSTLQIFLPRWSPKPQELVRVTVDVESDDLEEGETYAVFATEDLYEHTPTTALTKIRKRGVEPWMAMWEVREGSANER